MKTIADNITKSKHELLFVPESGHSDILKQLPRFERFGASLIKSNAAVLPTISIFGKIFDRTVLHTHFNVVMYATCLWMQVGAIQVSFCLNESSYIKCEKNIYGFMPSSCDRLCNVFLQFQYNKRHGSLRSWMNPYSFPYDVEYLYVTFIVLQFCRAILFGRLGDIIIWKSCSLGIQRLVDQSAVSDDVQQRPYAVSCCPLF